MGAIRVTGALASLILLAACSGGFTSGALKGKLSDASGTTQNGTPLPGGLPTVTKACTENPIAPGRTPLRRLSHREYNNTVRDLLLTTQRPADKFQSNAPGSSGYSNEASALVLSDQLVIDYAGAAETLATEFVSSRSTANGAVSKLAGCFLATTLASDCPKQVITSLGERAFRRPLTATESTELLGVYTSGGGSWQGLHDVVMALLLDPRFLFLNFGNAAKLDAHSLASRLSYFVWQSMPDEALLKAASAGELANPAQLQAQIARMLKDNKAKMLASVLRDEMAGLASIDTITNLPLASDLLSDIRTESRLFFEDLVMNDGSFLDIVNGRSTFVNSRLASHYGWDLPSLGTQFAKVQIPEAERRGIATQAGFLIVRGGAGAYTHPVPRGRWVAKTLLCAEPPPPPPDIPAIGDGNAGTMRQRLAVHAQGTCLGCHKIMDPTGLALELFDPFGKSRTVYRGDGFNPDGAAIDASGSLEAPKVSFNGPGQMLETIAQSEAVKSCITRNLMSLALNRLAASSSDVCVAKTIGIETLNSSSRLSEVIYKIVASPQFQGSEAQ